MIKAMREIILVMAVLVVLLNMGIGIIDMASGVDSYKAAQMDAALTR